MTYLFTYGTLRRDHNHPVMDAIRSDVEFVGMAEVSGRLFEIDGYPGLILDAEGYNVIGELYAIKNPINVFEVLDTYEECTDKFPSPHEYIRKEIDVQTNNGCIKAYCYLYTRNTTGLREIFSGDYLG